MHTKQQSASLVYTHIPVCIETQELIPDFGSREDNPWSSGRQASVLGRTQTGRFLKPWDGYEFMEMRNSSLFCVRAILSFTSVMASMAFMSARNLRRIHIRSNVILS